MDVQRDPSKSMESMEIHGDKARAMEIHEGRFYIHGDERISMEGNPWRLLGIWNIGDE